MSEILQPVEQVVQDAPQTEVIQPEQGLQEVDPSQPVEQPTQPTQKEPGYIRQRIDKAVARAVAETEARMQAMFDQQLAPLRESMMDRQASELVESGEFKSKETALEYVRLKAGMPMQAQPVQPRDEQGRFTSQEDPMAQARASVLASQADKIRNNRGLDVMSAFNSSPGIRQKVLSGEWDFYDVAENMQSARVPSPMYTPNGASFEGLSINQLSDEQFEQLNRNLAAGKTYR
jgi:hypothetical protein